MTPSELLHAEPAALLDLTHKLRVAYQLKRTLRYDTARDFSTHSESVAEHVFALFFLARFFKPLEDPDNTMDLATIDTILLFHDFGEIINGDVVYNVKTKEHEAQEHADAQNVFASLPKDIGALGLSHWEQYELHTSREARFARALDKIEPLFELLDPVNERSLKRHKFTKATSLAPKIAATEAFPIMRRFVEIISDDMEVRRVYWEPSDVPVS